MKCIKEGAGSVSVEVHDLHHTVEIKDGDVKIMQMSFQKKEQARRKIGNLFACSYLRFLEGVNLPALSIMRK